jgi:hypothetical protein
LLFALVACKRGCREFSSLTTAESGVPDSICNGRSHAEYRAVLDRPLRPIWIGDVAAWMSHILECGLYGPAGFDLGLVAQLDRHLIVADRLSVPGMKNHVASEGPYVIRNVCIDEACAELVIGAVRDHAGDDNAASKKKLTWLLSEGLAEIRLKIPTPLSGPPFTGR